jgi:hypothetical protein
MVALSFQPRFVAPIQAGLGIGFGDPPIPCEPIKNHGDAKFSFIARPNARPKRQTIRDRARAKPGDLLQLYCAQRNPAGFLIGKARCIDVKFVRIEFTGLVAINRQAFQQPKLLDEFARMDGFDDFADQREFWRKHHPGVAIYEGALTLWEPLP